jgi:hypothetical protein
VSDDDMLQVIREAEGIVRAAGWHLQEQAVLERLAGIRGLACARLEPRSAASWSPTTGSTSGTSGAMALLAGKSAGWPC